MKFRYTQQDTALPKSDSIIDEVLPEFKDEIKEQDKTTIKSQSIKLYFYSSENKEVTVLKVQKFKIEMCNDYWHQTGRYLIAKQPSLLELKEANIVTDDDSLDEIKQIIEDDKDIGSFIAIETKFKLQNSHPSK